MIHHYTFPKSKRILSSRDFQRIKHKGQKRSGRLLFIEWRFHSYSESKGNSKTRLGISVPRQFGKSHDRNRFKRILREAFRLSYEELPSGLDIVVKPKLGIHVDAISLQKVKEELLFLCPAAPTGK